MTRLWLSEPSGVSKCLSTKVRSPVGENKLLGPDLVQEADEKVEMLRKRLLTTQSRQKSYAEGIDLEKKEGDHVFLSSLPPV